MRSVLSLKDRSDFHLIPFILVVWLYTTVYLLFLDFGCLSVKTARAVFPLLVIITFTSYSVILVLSPECGITKSSLSQFH